MRFTAYISSVRYAVRPPVSRIKKFLNNDLCAVVNRRGGKYFKNLDYEDKLFSKSKDGTMFGASEKLEICW